MKNRWPASVHSQVEAIFHNVRSIRSTKECCKAGIRSFGSWKVYRSEAHRFAIFLMQNGCNSILDTALVRNLLKRYLQEKLAYYSEKRRSLQTLETMLSALSKLEHALNQYITTHNIPAPFLETQDLRQSISREAKKSLRKSSRIFSNRAYPDPFGLLAAIEDETYQLQAALQLEGGLRSEGAGSPSNIRLKNPLTITGLIGIGTDPVTNSSAGIVSAREKGGKTTEHFISVGTYKNLEEYIFKYGRLESDYRGYLAAVNEAAKKTGQFVPGRGTHALKHNFAQERYFQCIENGMRHEQALQRVSLETAHFRLSETLTYTRG